MNKIIAALFAIIPLTGCNTMAGIQKDIQATQQQSPQPVQPVFSPSPSPSPIVKPTIVAPQAIAPTAVAPESIVFNATVKEGSNCRKGAGKSFSVQQVFQSGDVALDKKVVRVDGENWYLERYQSCYVNGSLVNFKK